MTFYFLVKKKGKTKLKNEKISQYLEVFFNNKKKFQEKKAGKLITIKKDENELSARESEIDRKQRRPEVLVLVGVLLVLTGRELQPWSLLSGE